MTKNLSEADLLDALKKGVSSTANLMARLSDYHGGPVETEYLITADIARALVDRDLDVKVEHLNRFLVNAMTRLRGTKPSEVLGAKRTDVVAVDHFQALAMIEVKIRVRTLAGIREDLKKITDTIGLMNASSAAKVIGASVFQVHIPGTRYRFYAKHFKAAARRVEARIQTQLAAYAAVQHDFTFRMHSLQPNDGGIVARDLEPIGDELVWGADGHATRYHAILIRSTRPIDPVHPVLSVLRQRAQSSR